jgi:hypothetical protein
MIWTRLSKRWGMMVDHWMTTGLLGANASFQRAARKYAEEYAAIAVAAERARCAALCDAIAHIDSTGYGIAEDCAIAIRTGMTSGLMHDLANEAPQIDRGA